MQTVYLKKEPDMFGKSLNRDNRTAQELLDEALAVANQSDVIVAALGEAC